MGTGGREGKKGEEKKKLDAPLTEGRIAVSGSETNGSPAEKEGKKETKNPENRAVERQLEGTFKKSPGGRLRSKPSSKEFPSLARERGGRLFFSGGNPHKKRGRFFTDQMEGRGGTRSLKRNPNFKRG